MVERPAAPLPVRLTTPPPNPRTSDQVPIRCLEIRANRERILAAATVAVSRDGERVPMATIAEEAGVGIGTVYRHYPTRPALLAALTLRSFRLVLDHARAAALSDEPAPAVLALFFEQTIAARDEFVLPLHGGPVIHDERIVALQSEIRALLEQILARGRRDRTIRPDATPNDIILTGAMLAQPLPHTADWDQLARRQARIFLAGLTATDSPLPGSRPARGPLEAKSMRVAHRRS
jgi:AcrR family transcriptional regulator